jgi:hypothetical protein
VFDKIKAKIDELKAEIESAATAEEIKADEEAIRLLSGWVDGLTNFKKVLEVKDAPVQAIADAELPKGTKVEAVTESGEIVPDPISEADQAELARGRLPYSDPTAFDVQGPREEPAQDAKIDVSEGEAK